MFTEENKIIQCYNDLFWNITKEIAIVIMCRPLFCNKEHRATLLLQNMIWQHYK